ncbi:MAG: hypothetical protein IJ787_00345 [Bacilli bacterium]|nr:hypothetical protein [Bacilli bacterium]
MLLLALENQGFFVENLRKTRSDFVLNAEDLEWWDSQLSLQGMMKVRQKAKMQKPSSFSIEAGL